MLWPGPGVRSHGHLLASFVRVASPGLPLASSANLLISLILGLILVQPRLVGSDQVWQPSQPPWPRDRPPARDIALHVHGRTSDRTRASTRDTVSRHSDHELPMQIFQSSWLSSAGCNSSSVTTCVGHVSHGTGDPHAQHGKIAEDPFWLRQPRSSHFPSSLTSQCLSSSLHESNDAAESAEIICSCAVTSRIYWTLNHPNPVFSSSCWSSSDCLPPVLSKDAIDDLESEVKEDCGDRVVAILTRIKMNNDEMENSTKVLSSGHWCDNDIHCQECKDWYKRWMCLQKWEIFEPGTNRVIPPCPTSCGGVQMSCPFLTIHEDASMAAGDPTFACQESSITSSTFEVHQNCCYEVQNKTNQNFPTCNTQDQSEPAPAEGEWRDLNSTCCSLFNRTETGGGGGDRGSKAQNCDKTAMANRTLIVRRRTEAEMLDTGEVSWSDLLNVFTSSGSSSRMSFFSLSSTATLVLLPPILIVFSKFYS